MTVARHITEIPIETLGIDLNATAGCEVKPCQHVIEFGCVVHCPRCGDARGGVCGECLATIAAGRMACRGDDHDERLRLVRHWAV